MWKLAPPSHTARETFKTCIGRVRDVGLATRLATAADHVAAASQEFDKAARVGGIHELKALATGVGVEEMEKVYTQRMAKAGSPGRHVYDDILSSSPQGRCPLCTQRLASTLDHYMPKSRFPELAVAPLNLVPACSDCNKAKLAAMPTSAETVTLHPYYDDLGEDVWLRARVVELSPAAIRFDVLPPASWNAVLARQGEPSFQVVWSSEALCSGSRGGADAHASPTAFAAGSWSSGQHTNRPAPAGGQLCSRTPRTAGGPRPTGRAQTVTGSSRAALMVPDDDRR